MPLHFPFDPNIARAQTIPARLYIDPVYLELEREKIFARTWQLVGRTEQVAESGQFFTTEVAGESLVVLRDGDTLRAFHNVCLHRAGPVAYGCGKRQTLQCKYHGWTYDLTGNLLRAPEMEGVERFSPADMHLQPVQVASWGPLVFVNVDPKAPPLAELLEDIPERAAHFHPERMRWVMRKDYEIACNWKVYVDNYLEGYHIPIVHPGLFRELDYPNYRTETKRSYSIQVAPTRRPERIRTSGGDDQVRYFWIFPNLMLNVYPDNFSTNLIVPLGHGRTATIFEWYFKDPDAAKQQIDDTVAFSDEIQLEDIDICEAVQRGLQSSTYDAGRYSPQRENGVHHFHCLYAELMG